MPVWPASWLRCWTRWLRLSLSVAQGIGKHPDRRTWIDPAATSTRRGSLAPVCGIRSGIQNPNDVDFVSTYYVEEYCVKWCRLSDSN